ncbi:hypothetical protein CU016_1115 [Enterococcus lactis]|nr:hypothetical protein [Enterococcus lactis]
MILPPFSFYYTYLRIFSQPRFVILLLFIMFISTIQVILSANQ